ncbi:hypothetical protein A2U01_0072216, partial [Trifolium medium]|nr:hypothetical protein [Trifolium medium]
MGPGADGEGRCKETTGSVGGPVEERCGCICREIWTCFLASG